MITQELVDAIFTAQTEADDARLLALVEEHLRESPEDRYTIATALEHLATKRSEKEVS